MKAEKVLLKNAMCALDMGDGSERSFYVNQDYILRKMKKVHRGISLMYTYYPKDEIWPQRASIALPENKVGGAWNFPYEDYFPYLGGLKGNREAEPFNYMKEIRRRGQDVVLTLTVDPTLEDEYLIAIAKDLRSYGRMFLRINHECTGTWFCFNRRADYKTIADFFVRFAKILKTYAPNVKTILCAGMFMKEEGKVEMEDIFLEAHKACDIWSGDHYLSLHWGWPVTVCQKGSGDDFACYDVDEVYDQAKATLHRLREITGMDKPFVLSELNADGDVTGAFVQSNMVRHFMDRLEKDNEHWLSGFTFYQFRDDGRLGLEITDPNNSDVGIEQPMLAMYREKLHKPFFSQEIAAAGQVELPYKLRWGSAEDSEGLSMNLHFEKQPVFAEVYFDDDLLEKNLMLELGGYWFYKAPGVKCVDMMTLFYDKPLTSSCDMKLNIFAPPASGLNESPSGNYDNDPNGSWMLDTYTEIKTLPRVRLCFEEPQIVSKYEE
ncbi:MAG: hypothetical protein SPJ89_09645 [Treponema sp.]|nr:hypothetical protein [Spirochaetia bacterium]MDD7460779.1 hypothetical protein [Spirochaetales bacterium]MDY5812227.1 hypothetical protein [Treponema sp.]